MKPLLQITALGSLLIASLCAADSQPNVILIITDDAGWADYGFMRNADPAADPGNRGAVPTPNLDRLAADGITFTNAYTASVCSPSRAMITTGQYGTRFGYGSNIAASTETIHTAETVQGLPTEAVTIWERMQTVGYDTAAVGKWHIGEHANGGGLLGNRPENQGVEFFDGIWAGSRGYFAGSASGSQALRRTVSDGAGAISSTSVVESQYSGQYVTDVFGDQSVDYVRDKIANDSDPFFLYTSFTAPHTPMEATAADLAFIDSLNEPGFTGQRRTYAAMQYAMDRNVGKILDALEDPNNDGDMSDSVADNTLILFINDNGGDCCDSGPNSSDNGDLRAGKGSQFEGGMRVPMVVSGAGVNAGIRGTVSEDLVHAIDLVPTAFIGAGGGAFGASEVIDGENLLPYINGEMAGVAHEDLFIPRNNNLQSAIRRGKWKYMYQNGTGYQLYDLEANLGENNNVVDAPANAAVVADLHQRLASYHVQMDKPRHDNQADETNQFDHFLFREGQFVSAAFSSAGAWVDGDNPGAAQTATWRDGYADNRLTFRAKANGDYQVTNDLTSAGGFGYMANRITLDSATAPLADDHKATVAGLPVMMTTSRDGVAPEIRLDATDAVADRFTFQLDHDIEVYDDLTITGDGNQRFVFGGELREFRSGRNLTKLGSASIEFAGGVNVSGTVDLQSGRVAFTDGNFRGDLVASNTVALQVGGVGIVPGEQGGGDPPLQIVSTGLDLNFDAALDPSGDGIWFDASSANSSINFAGPASSSAVDTPTFPNLSKAYDISSSGGADGLNGYFETSGPRSRQDATFEIVFNVKNTSAGNDQVLFEAGGAARGVAMILNDGVLTFNVDGDASDIEITTPVSAGWRHLVGVIDVKNGADSLSLYLDNQLVGTLNGQTIDDWAGGNLFGLGAGASSVTGVSSGTGNPYHGDIALARFYSDIAFGSQEVDQNYQWLMQDLTPVESAPAVVLSVDGAFSMLDGSSLEIDLLSTDEFDRVEATSSVSLDGALVVSGSEGFAPSLGDTYNVVAGSSLSGEFDTLTLPSLMSDKMWQVQYDSTLLTLKVTIAGDYNGDGAVDAADYTVWRDSLGQAATAGAGADGDGDGLITLADFSVWQSNFGASFTEGDNSVATPEPSSAALMTLASLIGRWIGEPR